MPKAKSVLICTVGTSLFHPNLDNLAKAAQEGADTLTRELGQAYLQKNWESVARLLRRLDPGDRRCGAEINSIHDMVAKGYVSPDCKLYFVHSDTHEGAAIAHILQHYHRKRDHQHVETIQVAGLQDSDPGLFRTKGLRELAAKLCSIIQKYPHEYCAINATGGYKAQIAIAVLLGQAIGVPVYYKHERFSEIIAFPPMPVALDFHVWMRISGMLFDLATSKDPVPFENYSDSWDEKYDSLVERVPIDDKECLELSPTGQIFHDTFRLRFRSTRDKLLPPPASSKKPPHLEKAGWPGKHPQVAHVLERLTNEIPQVTFCQSTYYNPDLPERTRFVISRGEIVGIYSNGTWTVKFTVHSTAETEDQKQALVAFLNEWLHEQRLVPSR